MLNSIAQIMNEIYFTLKSDF